MSLFKKVVLVGLFSFAYSCQYSRDIKEMPGQGGPLYFFSEETKTYTEVHFLENSLIVFNEDGYIDLGNYQLLDSAVVRDGQSDTLAYLETGGSWIFLFEKRRAELKSTHELLAPRRINNSKDSLLEGYEWRKAILNMRSTEDTVIEINF